MEINEIVEIVMKMVVIPVLPLLATYLVALIKKNITKIEQDVDNAQVEKYLAIAEDVMIKAVVTTYETYTKSLKEQGSFGIEEQQIAFDKTVNAFNEMISDETYMVITEVYGDYEAYIKNQIESILPSIKE